MGSLRGPSTVGSTIAIVLGTVIGGAAGFYVVHHIEKEYKARELVLSI